MASCRRPTARRLFAKAPVIKASLAISFHNFSCKHVSNDLAASAYLPAPNSAAARGATRQDMRPCTVVMKRPVRRETGAYCKARQRLPEKFFCDVACSAGLTVTMPDTPKNQAAYPQVYNQQPGVGFPIARVGAIISLACGAILNLGVCRYGGDEGAGGDPSAYVGAAATFTCCCPMFTCPARLTTTMDPCRRRSCSARKVRSNNLW
jgi:hypothetical protein